MPQRNQDSQTQPRLTKQDSKMITQQNGQVISLQPFKKKKIELSETYYGTAAAGHCIQHGDSYKEKKNLIK